jgi:segregation and condensation protein A
MNETVTYKIETEVFQGPFDLLLQAIDEGKIDIHAVSLSKITDSYFAYWKKFEPPLVVASDFLYMAACLLEMKTKALLPSEEEIRVEEEDLQNVEQTLLLHIQEYETYKNVAQYLRKRKEHFEKIYGRHEGEKEEKEIELVDVTLRDLVLAFKKVYTDAVKREKTVSITAEEITIDDRIVEIKRMLAGRSDGVPFADIFLRQSRLEVLVTFLAILELAKQRFIKIAQGRRFGTILIFARGVVEHGVGTEPN